MTGGLIAASQTATLRSRLRLTLAMTNIFADKSAGYRIPLCLCASVPLCLCISVPIF
ncbi:MAG: hypothetical protein JW743_10555 [Deltaproteobacteria bacterium]|nr:hypothetical protein [Deltaproteobacteria bacterium]MBN2845477.1 hypothetical protein [Deltaproteobacteria bacterium]